MPKLIRDGKLEDDRWPADHIRPLEQWQALPGKAATAVRLEQDQPPAPLLEYLDAIQLIVYHFSTFMDGRAFSYARELRDRGYQGELRATGHFLLDQLHYLSRCGFDSFELADNVKLKDALAQFALFDQHYQASQKEPLPLFRRRS